MVSLPLLAAHDQASQPGRVVVIVGAESTGKTALAKALVEECLRQGLDAVVVPEYLRQFCDLAGRTPSAQEQALIADTQTKAIAHAASRHAWVVADTTALMTAVYSEVVFGDTNLYDMALAAHARADLTLLTALDLPWEADGLQRDGPHVREPVDGLIRQALMQAGLPFATVGGQGKARVEQAWSAVTHHWRDRTKEATTRPRWRWLCEKCDDGDCEQHVLPASLQPTR